MYWIRRSKWGYISIRFYGGCSYPQMIEELRQVYERFGTLIEPGEKLSGSQWRERIALANHDLSQSQARSIDTLMAEPARPKENDA